MSPVSRRNLCGNISSFIQCSETFSQAVVGGNVSVIPPRLQYKRYEHGTGVTKPNQHLCNKGELTGRDRGVTKLQPPVLNSEANAEGP